MTEDADVLVQRAKLYRSYGAIIQIDEAAKKITIDPNEPDDFNWLHAQRQVTIRGFICRQAKEKFVLEIIRLVEQEEPRLGTVYKVNMTEKGQLRAALFGPHEVVRRRLTAYFSRFARRRRDSFARCMRKRTNKVESRVSSWIGRPGCLKTFPSA